MLEFREITFDNLSEIIRLQVCDGQQGFVSSNAKSICEAYIAVSNSSVAKPFGIYNGNEAVGFIMFGYGRLDEEDPAIADNNYCLWKLMIDEKHQRKGYGMMAMRLAEKYMKESFLGKANYCWVSYEAENVVAKELYQKCGYVENGEICGGEIVAVRRLLANGKNS